MGTSVGYKLAEIKLLIERKTFHLILKSMYMGFESSSIIKKINIVLDNIAHCI